MGQPEEFYDNVQKQNCAADEKATILRYNGLLDTIQEIVSEIIAKSEIKETDRNITIAVDDKIYRAWIIRKVCIDSKIVLMSDGRLAYLADEAKAILSAKYDNQILHSHIIELKPISALSDINPKNCNTHDMIILHNYFLEMAKTGFDIPIKETWVNKYKAQTHI